MNPRILPLLSAFAVLFGNFASMRAQIVADGATNTLSNTTNSFASVTVGTNGSFTLLTLSNNALLTNSGNGTIGLNVTAKSNEVRLISSTARWRMGNNLFVGSNGAFSRLVISNGALVENFNGVLANVVSSSNNAVLVTGAGTTWSNRGDLAVGFSGRNNQLLVSNGGFVFNRFGYLGQQPGGSNNLARVTGSGSVWSNQFYLTVGGNDRSNRLIVEAGGLVTCSDGFVSGSSSSGNNEVLVTGSGSLWSNRFFLFMGDVAGRNRLVVSNGATVWSGGSVLGTLSLALSNQVIVTGPGSAWTNESSLSLGESSQGNRVEVSDGGRLACTDGVVGQTLAANDNAVFLTGNGSRWDNRTSLIVGNSGSGNHLVVSNAARVYAGTNASIGFNAASSSNTVLVTGVGSTWSNQNSLFVGRTGSGNRFELRNGASADTLSVFLGLNASSSNNEVTVTGPGSIWRCPEWGVGSSGKANRLLVSNGGQIRGSFGSVGAFGGGDNFALVTDSGSSWTNAEFYVGIGDSRNVLVVSNGGALSAQSIMVGRDSSSRSNRISVAGGTLLVVNETDTAVFEVRRGTNLFNAGLIDVDRLVMTNALGKFEFNGGTLITRSAFIQNGENFVLGAAGTNRAIWDVRAGGSNTFLDEAIIVGGNASFNQLILTNGNLLTNSGFADIGRDIGANSNSAVVSGGGSQWLLGDGVVVGRAGSGNRLSLSNGAALVTASISYLGFDVTSSNNEAVVSGPGTSWTTANFGLRVGNQGRNNRLLVSDGGMVSSFDDWVGVNSSSSNNRVLVTGAGSLWHNTRELAVGLNSSGNQLVVSNGATVLTVANRYVGQNDGAFSNTAIITDPGSAWLGDDSLYVGGDGSFNQLFVRNGARVTSGIATLGGLAAADGNQALVTDSGSSWTNQLDLNVGEGGSGNHLTISNAAILASLRSGFIGRNFTATSNSVTVTGPGSRWLISSNLFVGSNGPAASLVVLNGGRVDNAFATLGGGASSSNNWVLISGAGSIWSNRNNVVVGGLGRGSSLVVSNGARVESDFAVLANGLNSSNNEVLVSGSGSVWSNRNEFHVGLLGPANQFVVANGGRMDCNHATIGLNTSASNNLALVTDPGSFCRINISLNIGNSSSGNRLVISNGALFFDDGATIGLFSAHNEALVTGPGTSWTNRVGLSVGQLRGHNQLIISNGAFVLAGNVFISSHPDSTNNRVVMHGGTLLVTNTTGGAGAIDVRRGTNVFNAGLIDVARLWVTNTLGQFEFNGGKLVTSETIIANGRGFTVGNGVSVATFELRTGLHSFADNLIIASNASLIGNGTITGNLTVNAGGELSPGTSIGDIILSNSPVLLGTTVMEIRNDNGTISHDRVQVAAPLVYGSSLVVTHAGTNALAAGNRFPLFSATSYSGAFDSITLPPLPATLRWTNKLALDGSIEVIPYMPPAVELTIQLINGSLQVSWPTNGADYCLETSYDLEPPITWQTVSSGITTNGASFVFTLANAGKSPKQFFRLAFPCSPTPLVLSLQLSNNLVTVSWPSNEFRLETTFDLSPPATWQTVSSGISNSGGLRSFSFTNSPVTPKQFFRLAFP